MRLWSKFCVFVLSVLFASFCWSFFPVHGENGFRVHNVDTGFSYQTIQEAIDVEITLDGHVIRVDAGVYYEHVSLSKGVQLLGEDSLTTVIDGQGNGTVVEVLASNVTINGFTIRNSGSISGTSGVHVYRANFCNISRNIIEDNWYGIWLQSCFSPKVAYNNFTENQNAIYVDYSEAGSISSNSFSRNSFAVWFSGADTIDFQLNIVSQNDYAIWVTQSFNLSINANWILDNTDGVLVYNNSHTINLTGNAISSNINYAVFLNDCTNSNITGNHVSSKGKETIYIQNSRYNNVTNNKVTSNGYGGVYLYQSDSNTVSSNTVTEAKAAIAVYSSVANSISRNELFGNEQGIAATGAQLGEVFENNITENSYGIQISNSRNVKISSNNMSRNTSEGIMVSTSLSIELFDNHVSGSVKGLTIQNSSDTIITRNTFDMCEDGLRVEESRNNTITQNVFLLNSNYGLILSSSINNTLSSNFASNSTVGLCLEKASDKNTIINNEVFNSIKGIYIEQSAECSLVQNIVSANDAGLILNSSNFNDVRQNSLSKNIDGIRLYDSRNNTVELNVVSSNLGTGIHVLDSNLNMLIHNMVLNNSLKAVSTNSSNDWDNGVEGNFWGYEGLTDLNGDGIADASFILSDTDRDDFPLMGPYAQVKAVMDGEEYFVGIVCNSSISDFRYFREPLNATSLITFRVGEFDGLGFCRIGVPRTLIQPPFEVLVDNAPPLYQSIVNSNLTHSWLYFSFPYTGGSVRIVPAEPALPFWMEFWFWGIVALTLIVGALGLAIFFFYRRLGSYRETIEEFEKKLHERETSPVEMARKMFSTDVEERSAKISQFEEKYGVKIRPRDSLEDVLRGLKLKKKGEREDEVNS